MEEIFVTLHVVMSMLCHTGGRATKSEEDECENK